MRRFDRLQTLLATHARSTHTRVGRVLIVVLLGAGLQVATQTLLGRTLPKTQVGLISLILGALPLLSSLSMVGQDASTVRFLTRAGDAPYDTELHTTRTLALVMPLGLAAALLGAWYYGLAWWLGAALAVLVVSQNSVSVISSVMRASHRYEAAMTAVRLPGILSAVALVALTLAGVLTYRTAALGLAGGFALSAALVYFRRHRPGATEAGAKRERVPRSVAFEGLFFLGLGVSFAVMVAMDKLIIGKMMSYADLAVYASVFAIMRGFDFIFYSISFVLMPRVNVLKNLDLRRFNLAIAGLAAVVAAVYLMLGDEVVSFLYVGRYDEGAHLILPFALSGVIKLFYSVPSSVIGGRLPRAALKQFMWLNLAGMALNIALDIVLIRSMGLMGAAVATAIAWMLRLAGGYAIIALHRTHLKATGENR